MKDNLAWVKIVSNIVPPGSLRLTPVVGDPLVQQAFHGEGNAVLVTFPRAVRSVHLRFNQTIKKVILRILPRLGIFSRSSHCLNQPGSQVGEAIHPFTHEKKKKKVNFFKYWNGVCYL